MRFIERERRRFVAAIALAKAETAEDCGNPRPGANQLLDAALRAKVLAVLRCHQRQLDRTQSGMHKLNQDYESTLLELKLPSFTHERMLAEARASTLRQDADLASEYAHIRHVWQANVDFLMYWMSTLHMPAMSTISCCSMTLRKPKQCKFCLGV
jgi:hypothetical protein